MPQAGRFNCRPDLKNFAKPNCSGFLGASLAVQAGHWLIDRHTAVRLVRPAIRCSSETKTVANSQFAGQNTFSLRLSDG
jgi:hypothetical protein